MLVLLNTSTKKNWRNIEIPQFWQIWVTDSLMVFQPCFHNCHNYSFGIAAMSDSLKKLSKQIINTGKNNPDFAGTLNYRRINFLQINMPYEWIWPCHFDANSQNIPCLTISTQNEYRNIRLSVLNSLLTNIGLIWRHLV